MLNCFCSVPFLEIFHQDYNKRNNHLGYPIEHNVSEHGCKDEGQPTGQSLNASEACVRWMSKDAEPYVLVTDLLNCLH